jgi:putative membrane protein
VRRLRSIATFTGFSLVLYLIWDVGRADILEAFVQIGWGFTLVVAIEGVALSLRAFAWRALSTSHPKLPLTQWFLCRWIRQAVNQLLPVAQVGGELVGARALNKLGLDIAQAVSISVVDLTLGAIAQVVFTFAGLAIFLTLTQNTSYAGLMLLVALPLLGAVAGFAYFQQRGLVSFTLRRLASKSKIIGALIDDADAIDCALRDLYQRRVPLFTNLTIQLGSQIATTLEICLVCQLIGLPIGFPEAFVIQSLTRAVRAAAFFVPAGVGVQELSVLWLTGVFGIPPAGAMAIALVKRARELVVGLPALGVWMVREGALNR